MSNLPQGLSTDVDWRAKAQAVHAELAALKREMAEMLKWRCPCLSTQ
jgi:hypothetical protein